MAGRCYYEAKADLNYGKALKSSVSLARFFFQDGITERIYSIFDRSAVLQQDQIDSIYRIIRSYENESELSGMIEELSLTLDRKKMELERRKKEISIRTDAEFAREAEAIIADQMVDLGITVSVAKNI